MADSFDRLRSDLQESQRRLRAARRRLLDALKTDRPMH